MKLLTYLKKFFFRVNYLIFVFSRNSNNNKKVYFGIPIGNTISVYLLEDKMKFKQTKIKLWPGQVSLRKNGQREK